MKLPELMYPKSMQAFLREQLGTAIQVSHVKVAKRLPDYLVLLVSLQGSDQRLVVKAAGENAPLASQFERTAALHTLVARQTSIDMAEIYAADASQQTYPWRYLVKSYLPGVSLAQARLTMNESEIGKAFGQIGKAVGELHAIHFQAFGELDANLNLTPGLGLLEALQERAKQIIKNPTNLDFFLATLEKRKGWFCEAQYPCLVHDDLHAYNLLFHQVETGWELRTILDFEKAWAGSAESDLARLDFWRGMGHEKFWTMYRTVSAVPDGFSQRKALYQLLWCLEYAEPTTQHREDTQSVCQTLGIEDRSDF